MTIKVSGSTFEIRPVTEGESIAVLEVYRQCEDFLALGPVAKASLEMVQNDITASQQQGGIFCGIYINNGKMIGIVDYVPCNFEGTPCLAFLSLLMISIPFRKLGIGKAVVAAVETEIRKTVQVAAIHSSVQVNNPQAIRFWQKNGYRIISGPEKMPDQTTVFVLQKDLHL